MVILLLRKEHYVIIIIIGIYVASFVNLKYSS